MAANFRTTGKKIIAIGRNYADHAKELGNALPTEPFFFIKPTTSYLDNGGTIQIPKGVNCHYEVELGVVIGKRGTDVRRTDADQYIAGYALAIDMTARNIQEQVKNKGLPWSAAKGFDTFCPVGSMIEKSQIQDPNNVRLWLSVNDAIRQDGNTSDMVFKIPQLIEHVSSIMTVEPGDLLLTGTPAGVGPVKPGDTIRAGLNVGEKLLGELQCHVAERNGLFAFKL